MTKTIKDPGKFEGEPAYVRDIWLMMLDGGADFDFTSEWGSYVSAYQIDASLTEQFPDLSEAKERFVANKQEGFILLWESDDGFVFHNIVSEHTLGTMLDKQIHI